MIQALEMTTTEAYHLLDDSGILDKAGFDASPTLQDLILRAQWIVWDHEEKEASDAEIEHFEAYEHHVHNR